jgi:proline dehydrogenase
LRERDEISATHQAQRRRRWADGNYPALRRTDGRTARARLVRWAEAEGIARDRYEFQMPRGIRRDLQAQLLERGFRVRVHVPDGPQWYPYFMRRMAERPRSPTWVPGRSARTEPAGRGDDQPAGRAGPQRTAKDRLARPYQ